MFEVQKGDMAGFELYGERQEDGTIEIGHSGDTRTVDEWPETATIGPENFDFTLEYVLKTMEDGKQIRFEPENVPEQLGGPERGVYV